MALFARIVFLWTLIDKAQCEALTKYKKPVPSNGPCIERIEKLTATLEAESDSEINNCFGCTAFAKDECSFGCQDIIDSIYDACEGVTLPRYYYYDPPEHSIGGSFEDLDVKRQLKLSAAKCGCNSSSTRTNGIISTLLIGVVVRFLYT